SAALEPRLDLVEGHVVAGVDRLARRVDQRIAVRRMAKLEPMGAGEALQVVPAQLLRLGVFGTSPVLLDRRAARPCDQGAPAVGDAVLVSPRGSHRIHSDAAVSVSSSASGESLPF